MQQEEKTVALNTPLKADIHKLTVVVTETVIYCSLLKPQDHISLGNIPAV